MASAELARFLFEIASPERLAILDALGEAPRRHTEIAERLSITGSETTRHLTRLGAAGLVEKDPQGRYRLTELARAARAGLPLFEFLSQHPKFVAAHDLSVLEPRFVARLGELSAGAYTTGTYQVVAVQESALRAVQRRIWVVTEQRFEQALPILREKTTKGADVRVIRPRGALEEEGRNGGRVERNFSVRLQPEVRIFLAVLDDQAGLCLPAHERGVDMSTMLLFADPRGYQWCEDLFLHLWNRAEEWRNPLGSLPSSRGREG